MAVKLIYKHQQKTYDLMKDALEKRGRAAYVFPTGCGKSFPALKYIDENPNKKVTIFAPNLGIKNQYIKYIETYVENGKERLTSGNIEIKTYQKIYNAKKQKKERAKKARNKKTLNSTRRNMKSFSLKNFFDVDSDIVIFDEIHRIGAKKWEDVIDNIMQGNPNRKVIGMSATPERTDGRNMAYEKFGDDVVYEMSLTEALSGEKEGEVVLKTPRYVRVLSQLSPILKKYKDQIDLIEDDEERKRILKKYEKIDSIVNNSPSLSDVMLEGMKKKNGKYIIFCKDRKDMLEKMEQAGEIFGKVNTKINTSYVLSKNGKKDEIGKTDSQNRRTLEEFENKQEGEELNLLFCVDMLNEGVHIPKVDGEVLFDLTSSPILYKQRIGRVLSADKEAGETVIIDAANNWLNHIETYREIENAIKTGIQKDKNGNKNEDYNLLRLLPEELDLLRVMQEISESLRYNKNKIYEQIIEWLETHKGNTPRPGITVNRRQLRIYEMSQEEKEEVNLAERWRKSEIKKILEQYEEQPLENVPEEYRDKIATLRNYGIGISTYERIVEWLKTHNGNFPKRATQNRTVKKMNEMSEEERKETELRNSWNCSKEKRILDIYKGRPIEEVPEEFRDKIKTLRSLIFKEKTTYEQIIEWLETHDGKMPRIAKIIDGKRYSVAEMSQDEKDEINLRKRWERTDEEKILDEYAGRPIEEVSEEYREKIAKLRSLGQLGTKKDDKISRRAKKSVSKNVTNNESIRKELETDKIMENIETKDSK